MRTLKAHEILEHMRSVGHWVCWPRTVDRFYAGSPEAEVRGIAVAWSATRKALAEAARRDLNLVICHEPPFYEGIWDEGATANLVAAQAEDLARLGLTLLRCHDTWDLMPEVGVIDSWTRALGFPAEARPVKSYFNVCLVGNCTVRALAGAVLARTRTWGQDSVQVLGDLEKSVSRLGVGTGAICYPPAMLEAGIEAALVTDDSFRHWNMGAWALDMGLPLLIVNHATAELPGMQALAEYLAAKFPGLPTALIRDGFPPQSIHQ